GGLLGVGAPLFRGSPLALLALLRRRARCSRTGGHLDRRQRTPPGPCDLEAEQSHDHTQHHGDDRPAPHQVAPRWSEPPGGGEGAAAAGGAIGGGGLSPNPGDRSGTAGGSNASPPGIGSPAPGTASGTDGSAPGTTSAPGAGSASTSTSFALSLESRYPLTST